MAAASVTVEPYRVRRPFAAGSEPNGSVNRFARENGESENPEAKSRKTDGSRRARSEPTRNGESARTNTAADLCDNTHRETPVPFIIGASVNHSSH
jgi:hypothetical protein